MVVDGTGVASADGRRRVACPTGNRAAPRWPVVRGHAGRLPFRVVRPGVRLGRALSTPGVRRPADLGRTGAHTARERGREAPRGSGRAAEPGARHAFSLDA